jgi:hypothetical protein
VGLLAVLAKDLRDLRRDRLPCLPSEPGTSDLPGPKAVRFEPAWRLPHRLDPMLPIRQRSLYAYLVIDRNIRHPYGTDTL